MWNFPIVFQNFIELKKIEIKERNKEAKYCHGCNINFKKHLRKSDNYLS